MSHKKMPEAVTMKENPATAKHIRGLRIFLNVCGLWPGEKLGERMPLVILIHRWLGPVIFSAIIFGDINYYAQRGTDLPFLTQGHLFISIFIHFKIITRKLVFLFNKYGEITRKFIQDLHLVHEKHKGGFYRETYEMIEKVSYYLAIFTILIAFGSAVLFNVVPIYINYKNGVFFNKVENVSLEFSLYLKFPGVNNYDYFLAFSLFNWYIVLNGVITDMLSDALMYMMILQLIGHVQILNHNLENLKYLIDLENETDTKCVAFNDEKNLTVSSQLTECVERHKKVISFVDDISNVFGPVMAFAYVFHLVCICFLLLQLHQVGSGSKLKYGPTFVTVMWELLQMSILAEFLGVVSEKIPDTMYGTPWERMSVSNRRSVCIMLLRMQRPMHISAMGMADVGVRTMVGILKTTFSYYTFLETVDT